MFWRGVGSVLAGCGAGAVALLAVWLWPGQSVPPSMGPVVVVPVPHAPTPSATFPSGPGRPAVTPSAAVPGPLRTCSGGRPVPPSPPPAADDGGERASRVAGEEEKVSRAPRSEVDDEGDDGWRVESDDEETEASDGPAEDADDEWDD
ncbi:hypothetical protein GCM10010284_46680 [Streptomyces rubiginosohelvolus]|uniref:Secreted protein n=2 Tax=Streptomyces TaxID=1883 RepID=A0ABQ3BZW0_9ACTN|nr:hypothetical protein GCM10010284_46680 [Streptomyces rubiginosohelvolus]GGZ62711.1 hypothetical protein GCM10010328_41770 [Streptomyces pluricolorescens]